MKHLLQRLIDDPLFGSLADGLVMTDALRPYVLAALAEGRDDAVVAVVPSDADASALTSSVREFGVPAAALIGWDVLPFEGGDPDASIAGRRIEALTLLTSRKGPRVIVASARGFIQKPSPHARAAAPIEVTKGATLDMSDLITALVDAGYERYDVADEPGTLAVRGGIIDIFAATKTEVVRIEFDADTVESIRIVDPASQRSTAETDRFEIGARIDAFDPSQWDAATHSLSAIAPSGTLWLLLDPKRVTDEAERAVEQEEQLASLWNDPARDIDNIIQAVRHEPSVIYQPLERVLDGLMPVWHASSMRASEDAPELEGHAWDPQLHPRALLERCRELVAEGWHIEFCALPAEVDGMRERLVEEGLPHAPVQACGLHGGFVMRPLRLAVVTHSEWHARASAPATPARKRTPHTLSELKPGDLIVHALHGVGRYVGLETREVAGFVREYLVLEYANNDRLFVPSDAAEALTRYFGADQPKLNRLGTTEWERTKARVRKKVRDIASELIRLYSARLHAPGVAYPGDSPWMRELEESFPFDETPDQLRAIADVGTDMAKPTPMDRLIVGDVGFGKTEVAVRAAFRAVTEGKQVAVLVPTTLLAQQHGQTFMDRFGPFPVKVASLSRFQSDAEAEEILAGLATGEVDCVIGTHRLLGKDVKFHDLGLVIIDEEHRFGVAQKERLKRLRLEVDVLTMTATPIPRTLEMSMSGIRDLSVIETPPAARKPVRTFVGGDDPRLMTAAIRRELARGGQVFFVHNRVQTIESTRRKLERLVPEARIVVGHGQMDEHALEQAMLKFWHHEVDILLCTTIIEAGLDIPASNTLIVDHADKLGLAQLYQLRGRVGRGGEQAYAYLFYPGNVRLTEQAHERLKTLATYTELGSGMAIAMKDLEIRGSGNLLGAEQHGQIEAVGFEMYVKLLEEATTELQTGEPPKPPAEVRIDLPVDAYLPSSWIEREPLRLAAYRTVADTHDATDVADAEAELRDRFGPIPGPAQALLAVAALKALVRPFGIREIAVVAHELHGKVAKIRPVALPSEWQQVRMRRLHPQAVLSPATQTLILPLPALDGRPLVDWLTENLKGLFDQD